MDEWNHARLVPWREELRYVEGLLRRLGRPVTVDALLTEARRRDGADHCWVWFIRRLVVLVSMGRVEAWTEWRLGKVVLRFAAVRRGAGAPGAA